MANNRPKAPKTVAQYERILERARARYALGDFEAHEGNAAGIDVKTVRTWPNSQRKLLRAALKYEAAMAGTPSAADAAVRSIPVDYEIAREVQIPGEDLALAYEAKAKDLPPGYRALALLPLKLGLRASEVCSLSRAAVQEGARSGKLLVIRKGGRERYLPANKVKGLLEELLAVAPKRPRPSLKESEKAQRERQKRTWSRVGEILSCGQELAQYHALHKLITDVGIAAGFNASRPHLLRHAFATRMNRDGAPLFTIQRALDHASISTTQRYVHADLGDVEKFMR